MLSRVANNLFWIGRYMERSYGILLTTIVGYSDSQDFNDLNSLEEENMNTQVDSDFAEVIHQNLFDKENPNSIFNITYKARENSRSIQEQISRELWLCINKQYLFLRDNANHRNSHEDPLKILDEISDLNSLYYGIADLTQERGNSYSFMNCGKYLERIFRTLDFLETHFTNHKKQGDKLEDTIYWKNLLLSIGGYQLYLRTYKSTFKIDNIIDMLIFNKTFPHSVYYSIKKLETHINRLNEQNNSHENQLIFLIGKLESKIKYTTLDFVLDSNLKTLTSTTKDEVFEIATTFNELYFSNY